MSITRFWSARLKYDPARRSPTRGAGHAGSLRVRDPDQVGIVGAALVGGEVPVFEGAEPGGVTVQQNKLRLSGRNVLRTRRHKRASKSSQNTFTEDNEGNEDFLPIILRTSLLSVFSSVSLFVLIDAGKNDAFVGGACWHRHPRHAAP